MAIHGDELGKYYCIDTTTTASTSDPNLCNLQFAFGKLRHSRPVFRHEPLLQTKNNIVTSAEGYETELNCPAF